MSAAPGRAAGALVGALSGVLSGMLGIGGGLVVTPVLALRGLPLRRATGTAMGAVLACAVVAVATEALTEPGQLIWWAAVAVAVGAQLGVLLGRRVLAALPDATLRAIFVGFLLFAAARGLGLADFAFAPDGAATSESDGLTVRTVGAFVAVGVVGVGAGVSAVLFGIGGGVVVVPGLMLFASARFPEAAAVSLLAMIPTALAGLWVARRDDRIERGILRTLLPAAAVGAVAGVWLRNRVFEAALLEGLFAAFLLYAAARLWTTRRRTA